MVRVSSSSYHLIVRTAMFGHPARLNSDGGVFETSVILDAVYLDRFTR